MTEQEYREALHRIKVKAENERRMLANSFATEHSPVKVGDYISDNCDTIRVEDWIISHRGYEYNSLPCLAWYIKARPARRMALHASTRRSAGSSSATFCE